MTCTGSRSWKQLHLWSCSRAVTKHAAIIFKMAVKFTYHL